MLGLAQRSSPGDERTFKSRVQEFWAWYAGVATRFHATIEANQCPALEQETCAAVDRILGGGAWEFGPGAEGKGHAFTYSAEGNLHRHFLAAYWLRHAPTLPGWTFYCARQPVSIEHAQLDIDGRTFKAIEFWLTPAVDRERERIDITIWHPLFDALLEQQRWQLVSLYLDQTLGEYGTTQWIGEIKMNRDKLASAFPLAELPQFLRKVEFETGWTKPPPGEGCRGYQLQDTHDRFPRGDIFVGTTRNIKLVQDYVTAEGDLPNPLAGSGADFAYVAFDASWLPKGREAEARGEIEDALDAALRAKASGELIGGAHGEHNAYIDLLLMDGSRSADIVCRVLRERGLPPETTLNYFARERRGQGFRLGG